jgi:hypothetical protein
MGSMSERAGKVGGLVVLVAAMAVAGPISSSAGAHDTIRVGAYTVGWGWEFEPPCANEENTVFVEVYIQTGPVKSPVLGAEANLTISLEAPGGETRPDRLSVGEENGTYLGKRFIPTSTGYYLLHLGGKVLEEPVNETVKMDLVVPSASGCRSFPSATQEGRDEEARRMAAEAWDKANATARQMETLTLLVYAALGVGGASLALAGYNAHLSRQSLAIARQKESRAKGEAAADDLLRSADDEAKDSPKPVEVDVKGKK